MTAVPRTKTTPTIPQWRDAITVAWNEIVGSHPSDNALAVLWSQFALETGRGEHCYCHNLGNIKAGVTWAGDFCILHTFEFIDGQRVEMDDRFRAFPTLLDGARDYIRFLTRTSYAEPFEAIVEGDPHKFAYALKAKGYYTAPVEQYAHGLVTLAAEFKRSIPPEVATTEAGLRLGDNGPANLNVDRLESELADAEANTDPQGPAALRRSAAPEMDFDLDKDPDSNA